VKIALPVDGQAGEPETRMIVFQGGLHLGELLWIV